MLGIEGDVRMKRIGTILCLLFLVAVSAYSGQAVAVDLGKDNPNTLIGTKSTDYRIYSFRLGLTHDQTWEILRNNNLLLGEIDGANPSRIYVYSRNVDSSKGKAILYLIWEPREKEMSKITVFQDCRSSLSQNFRRLLSFEAVDDNSDFKRNFIGYANRSKITLDVPSIDLKHTTYFYDEIGLEVTHKHSSDGEEVVFAIVKHRP
jgi:hypothetical protein